MQSVLAPLVVALLGLGLAMVNWQAGQLASGTSQAGRMQALAEAAAQQAEAFSDACLAAASASPGLVSPNIW